MVRRWLIAGLATVTLAAPTAEQKLDVTHHSAEFGRVRRSLFMDPSDANRAALTKHLVEGFFEPLGRPEMIGRWQIEDGVESFVRPAGEWADDELLRKAMRALHLAYKQHQEKLRRPDGLLLGSDLQTWVEIHSDYVRRPYSRWSPAKRARVLAEAESYCLPPNGSLDHDDCYEQHLHALVRSGDRRVLAILNDEKDPYDQAAREWLSALESPDRARRIARFLPKRWSFVSRHWEEERPKEDHLAEWAFDELVGGFDPRRWKPENVAAFVWWIRECETYHHEVVLVEKTRLREQNGPFEARSHGPQPYDPIHFSYINRNLLPMGLENAYRLVRLRHGGGEWLVEPDPHNPNVGEIEHFSGEADMYEDEWTAAHGELSPGDGEVPKDYGARLDARQRYVYERWLEMDRMAPTPDLKAIEKILTRWEAEKRKKDGP